MTAYKVRPDDASLLHETRDSASMEHCSSRVLFQVVANVSNNVGYLGRIVRAGSNWKHTASCSQDVVEKGFGNNGPRIKVASGLYIYNIYIYILICMHVCKHEVHFEGA